MTTRLNTLKKSIVLLVVLISCNSIQAKETTASQLQDALNTAKSKALHNTDDWQHLIQYISRTFNNKSQIKSDHSFFANDGKRNPENELLSTISAIFKPVTDFNSADDHPRCKFLARYHFLSSHISFPDSIKSIECSQFNQWMDVASIDSVSLIFASGYFKNPASFYGHPLLKFNTNKDTSSRLLDITLNNGAIVPPNENPITYMVKGVFGGYKAGFSDTKFYQLNHDYSESDLRDLWEYELDLSHDQKQRLAYYSWELLGQRFTYSFFQQNCGYFLEDLLQYALGERISPRRKLYTLPATTFFNLVETQINGRPIVKKISRTASRHNRLYEKFMALNDTEKKMVHHYVQTADFLKTGSDLQQLRVIDTLIDYYTFLISKSSKSKKNQPYISKRTSLYSLRLSLIKTEIKWPEIISSTPPHTGSKPTLLQLGFIYNSELGEGVRLRLRPASYDLIDLDDGHVPNSTLNMFNIEAVSINGKQRLTRLDLVDIQTLNISRTGLPGDGGLGWGLRVGLERAEKSCLDCLVGQVSGSVIKGKKINENWTVYSKIEGTYHSNYQGRSLRTSAQLGLIGRITSNWKSQLTVGQQVYLDGNNQTDSLILFRNRIGNNPSSNIVFDLSYDGTTEAQISYGYYW